MECSVQIRTAALIEQATALHDDLAVIFARSRALIALGHARRLSATYPRLRVIRGGSDAALITETVADAKLCLHCIATMAGVSINQVDAALVTITKTFRLRIGPALALRRDEARCVACGETAIVCFVGRPPDAR
jgi:hypothetical protein